MKDYELSVLIHPDLEMNPDPAIDKIKKIIDQAGGTITSEDNQGKKRLAYPIKGQTFALYYYADVTLPADAPDKISSSMNIADEIIRYLLVRTDPRKAKYEAKRTEAEARNSRTGDDSSAESSEETTKDANNSKEDK